MGGPTAVTTPAYDSPRRYHVPLRLLAVVALLLVFLVGIKGLGDGFKLLGRDTLDTFFAATSNPFVGLVVGILATTLVQSSSVTTSMIVGLVAAPENPLPLINAVPMIMGANIGTTVTNTIVSLAHMGRKDEFKRAFAVATCHDFFNFMTVALLLPLELATGYLSKASEVIAGLAGPMGGVDYDSPLDSVLKIGLAPIKGLATLLFNGSTGQAVVTILLSGALIFFALGLIVTNMRQLMQTKVEQVLSRVLSANALVSMMVGMIATVAVQSSSITTSLLVPLAGAGMVTLRQAFPITLGANVGTTLTALLASMAASGANAKFGVQIALVHLLFNLTGILLIYPVPAVRELPMKASAWLARVAVRSKRYALLYVAGIFFGVPAALVWVHSLL